MNVSASETDTYQSLAGLFKVQLFTLLIVLDAFIKLTLSLTF